jgi:hypothetical protein
MICFNVEQNFNVKNNLGSRFMLIECYFSFVQQRENAFLIENLKTNVEKTIPDG